MSTDSRIKSRGDHWTVACFLEQSHSITYFHPPHSCCMCTDNAFTIVFNVLTMLPCYGGDLTDWINASWLHLLSFLVKHYLIMIWLPEMHLNATFPVIPNGCCTHTIYFGNSVHLITFVVIPNWLKESIGTWQQHQWKKVLATQLLQFTKV